MYFRQPMIPLLLSGNAVLHAIIAHVMISSLKKCGHCLLFAQVFEVSRVLVGGSRLWCSLVLFVSVFNLAMSTLLVFEEDQRGLIRPPRLVSRFKSCIAFLNLVSTIFSAFLVSFGFWAWCRSYVVNSCSRTKGMDWYHFRPKYSDCGDGYFWMTVMLTCVLCACFCQCCLRILPKVWPNIAR
ncbi:uncharacterized protein LOC125561043 isoform X2 [Nematostella vectensis]|nr:uncharacterized protein LOC125561043 isoform X2 [Nematostella vectensis]